LIGYTDALCNISTGSEKKGLTNSTPVQLIGDKLAWKLASLGVVEMLNFRLAYFCFQPT
jgi:hypothetical protein